MTERVLRAKLLFIGDGSVLKNGMICIDQDGKILEVGLDIKGDKIEEFESLCPGFINAHCHLELSHLHKKVPMHGGLHSFLPSIQSQREMSLEEIHHAIQEWDEKMRSNGIVGVGDISNSNHSLEVKKSSEIHYHTFIELFGLRSFKAGEIYQKGVELKEEFQSNKLSASLSPHSPYSVSEKLFQLIQKSEKVGPISIHNQESEGEIMMFKDRNGPLKEMLLNFGNNEDSLTFEAKGSLEHIFQFIDIDIPFQLVHNTYSSLADIEFAEAIHSDLFWCFCPSANWYIEKRLPNIPLFLKKNVKCTLGTDSLASNDGLSILSEMKLIKEHYAEIPSAKLIQWACKNGAEFLKMEELGEIKAGKKCGLNEMIGLGNNGEIQKDTKIKRII